MALTEVLRSDTFEQWRTKTNTVSSDLGDRATLSANITANTSLVGAINELQSDIGVIGSLSTFAASNVVAALNELKTGSSVTISGTKTFSSNLNLSSGQAYTIDGTSVLNATTLGSGVVNSSLTTVGTIGTGTWQGTIISPTYGGTGINNGSRTLTISTGNLALTTAAGGSSLTLPASGTVATLAGNETLTTKTINLASNTLTGTLAQFNAALSDDDFAGLNTAQTLLNKTIALGSNTISGTLAQFNTALTDDDFAALSATQTLTNKSLQDSTTFFIDETTPTKRLQFQLSGISANTTRTLTIPDNSGTIALTSDTTFIGTTSITLSRGSGNLALTGISSVTLPGSTSGTVALQPAAVAGTTTITLPATSGTVVTTGDTGTVTNTMLAGSIANGKLTNSSVTFNGVAVALGGSGTITANTTNALTIGDGLSGGSFNGSAAVTIAADATIARRADTHFIGTTSVALNRASANLGLTGISSVTLPGSTSGTVVLQPAAVSGTTTITLPATSGTVVTTGDTGTVTNTMLAGSIANAKLTNSSVTVGSTTISLGSTSTSLAGLTSATFAGSTSGTAQIVASAVSGTTVLTLPSSTTGTLVTTGDTGTVSNAMLAGGIANAKLTNSTVTFNGAQVSLGGSATITANTTNTLTIGDGLSGTSFNGSAAVTISADATIARAAAVHYIGTTSVALNRASGSLALTGISSIDFPTAGTNVIKLTPASTNALVTLTMPAQTGTIVTTGDTGTVTNTMLAGSIANAKLTNSSVTIGTTAISLGTSSTTLAGLTSVTSTSFVGPLTGNADTATKLATARTINGVSFDGTANILVTADATTLTGTALKNTIVGSSLTSVGTITTGVWNGTSIGTAYTDAKIVSVAGTANQVTVANTSGAITLSLPQSIATTSNVTFAGVTATTVTAPTHTTASGDLTLTSAGGTVIVSGKQTNNVAVAVASPVPVVTLINTQYPGGVGAQTDRFNISSDGSVVIRGNLTVEGNTTITSTTYSPTWSAVTGKVYYGVVQDNSGNSATPGDGTTLKFIGSNGLVTTVAEPVGSTTDTVTIGITSGGIALDRLVASSITVNPGTGMSGGGTVSLGNSITLNNADGGSAQSIFKNIAATGSTTFTAGTNNDTLNFASDGSLSITLTTTGGNKTVNITHATMGNQASVDNSGGSVIQDVTLSNGHVTGLTSVNLDSRYIQANQSVTLGDLTVSNLTVGGTLTYVNSTNLEVTDKNILLAKGSNTESLLNGSGITFGELASNTPTLSYSYTASPLLSKFVFNRNLEAASFIRTGGTNAQFLKADGSVDSTSYQPAGNYQPAGTYVTSVGGSAPVASSGGTTPSISLNTAYGDTQNPYGSKTQKFVLAAPNGADGVPTFRALVASDIPPLNYQPAGTYVTSVGASSPISSSGGTTPSISLSATYGDTLNPYGLKNANTVLAGPTTGAAAAPTFRALVAADIPSLDAGKITTGTFDAARIPALNYQAPGSYLTAESDTLQSVANRGATTTVAITVASPLTITKTSNTARISFPVVSGGNDPGYIEHVETPADTAVMRFSVGDNNDAADKFSFGNTSGVSQAYVERFSITANGNVVASGTISASNFSGTSSGTNTGDQDLSGYLTTTSAASTYLTITSASTNYQPKDADLTAIAALSGTSGLLKKTAADTWTLDTTSYQVAGTYVTSVSGSGTVAGITLSGGGTTTAALTLGGTFSAPIASINDSTTVGQNLVKLTNPDAIRFLRVNVDNTVSALTDAQFRTAIGAGTGNGTVTSVSGSGTVAGITLGGSGSTTAALTLSGTFSAPIANINDSTTVGQNLVKLTNPGAITFLRINADNTVSALTDAQFRTAIGAGTSSTNGTVTAVSASGPLAINNGGSTTPNVLFLDQAPNRVLAGPATGTTNAYPTFRALVAADIPPLNYQAPGSYLTAESDTLQTVGERGKTLSRDLAGATIAEFINTNAISGNGLYVKGGGQGGASGGYSLRVDSAGGSQRFLVDKDGHSTVAGNSYAAAFIKSGAFSTDILKGDGSTESDSNYVKTSGNQTISGTKVFSSKMGIGSNSSTTAALNFDLGFDSLSAAQPTRAIWLRPTFRPNSIGGGVMEGIGIVPIIDSSYWSESTPAMTYSAIRIGAVTRTGTTAVTETRGLYIDNCSLGTTNYAIYSAHTGASVFSGSLTATSLVKSGGTSSQFLKADGSVDSNTYLTSAITSVQFTETASGTTNSHSGPLAFVLKGTANQVIIGAPVSVNQYTLSLPQNINTAANVQFGSIGVGTAASGVSGEIRAIDNITAYYTSDERLKTNVRKIENALDKVTQINGVVYDWNDTYKKSHGDVDGYFVRDDNSGVIAQEVEKVFPNVVGERQDGFKAVRYELLVPLLIEAIKDLKAEIESLKAAAK